MNELVVRDGALPANAEPFCRAIVVPKLVADAGDKAAKRYAISSPRCNRSVHTRRRKAVTPQRN